MVKETDDFPTQKPLDNFYKKAKIPRIKSQFQEKETKDDWIPWTGGECPVDGSDKVQLKLKSGAVTGVFAASFFLWADKGCDSDILAYRVVN